jgi:hypothetical protein
MSLYHQVSRVIQNCQDVDFDADDVLYMNIVVFIQLPCTMPVRSHILWSGRHCVKMTTRQMVQKVMSKAIVTLQSRSKGLLTAIWYCQHKYRTW